jgi:hypothetical protein
LKSEISKCESSIPTLTFYISIMDFETEAIDSIVTWYQSSARHHAYLDDVSIGDSSLNVQPSQPSQQHWEPSFRASRWFTRGWTLQELVAPRSVEFYSQEGRRLGDKLSLQRQIHEITRIPLQVLDRTTTFPQYSVDERFSWAQTTRNEDWAYCLLGIFDAFMPLLYSEGKERAIIRLNKEVNEALKGNPRSHCAKDHPDIVEMLLQAGADPKYTSRREG